MDVFAPTRDDGPMKQALRIGVSYLILAAAWIYFSDLAVERLVTDPASVREIQTWKGWGFVLASAGLLVFLIRREIGRVERGVTRLRALVEQSVAGIYLVRDGRFLYVNRAMAEIFGYGKEEMRQNVRVVDVVAEEDEDLVLNNLALREEGHEEDIHYRFTALHETGRTFGVEVHGTRVEWEGSPAVLGVLLDVSERERLERQVRASQRMETMGKLTGQIAHDFNNLLTGIIGPLDLCLDRLEEGSEERVEATEARQSAVRAADLSRKLLAFSRNRPTIPQIVDVNRVIRDLRALLERIVGSTVEIRFDLDPEECLVELDPTDLEQVLVNLVLNGGEAIESSGTVTLRTGRSRKPEVWKPGSSSNGEVWLEVEDDGAGMDREEQVRIFEPFFTSKPQGTGLGLSTVFGIVEQARGEIEVRSEPGAGTVFRLELPAAVGEPLETRAERSKESARLDGQGERVLVVDDEPAVLGVVERALERFGYEVLVAESAEEAEAIAASAGSPIDLLLTDIRLPDGVGPEVADRFAGSQPEGRVLYMSGFSDEEVADRLARTRDVRLIEKPFSIGELLDAVHDALANGERGGSRAS